MSRRTKIVATLGPASDDPARLEAMIRAGVDVVRINLSHGTIDEHLVRLATVRQVAQRVGRPVGVLADLPGPKIRAGAFAEGGVDLAPGTTVRLVPGSGPSSADLITVGYPTLLEDLDPDDRVVLGDGGISMRVVAVTPQAVLAEVESGGRTQGRPGVHLACERLQMFAPTAEDLVLAEAVAAAGVEYIALSFVRRAADVVQLRAVVGDRAGIVAKIETSSALVELAEITAAADGVMVARGDLGIDCPLEDVPHLQKHIVRHCVAVGTPVITATQMLESMIDAPAPTRAEVSDVANAVFDGTDAVMLSAETAIGHDPVLVVATMARIAARAELEASYRQWAELLGREQRNWSDDATDRITLAVTHAAWQAAHDAAATAILCCTRSGRTVRAMARFRPSARLIGLSPDPATVAGLTLSWGVESVQVEEYRTSDEMVWFAVETAVHHGFVAHGDIVLVLAGAPDRDSGAATDVLRVVRIE
ncbi:MAG: pyruvate kinase [Ilumatobacteraceae bacterium]